ncbi:hypothetical protein GCK72_026195 [Caenorhabditis remanei]|uniref:Uncharacterized protein n=1 Tax=Caenorhabditis remanei TaxID=31234 RepID=A0A6A5G452_CAERE|nr:hypothetical protein GCK72_026195 [Caenorhabditis remanei]KAF1749727.1 hypothetical protein GCK72_026195 [Caenorhabditis remanei]
MAFVLFKHLDNRPVPIVKHEKIVDDKADSGIRGLVRREVKYRAQGTRENRRRRAEDGEGIASNEADRTFRQKGEDSQHMQLSVIDANNNGRGTRHVKSFVEKGYDVKYVTMKGTSGASQNIKASKANQIVNCLAGWRIFDASELVEPPVKMFYLLPTTN